jgi:hypothetical protein
LRVTRDAYISGTLYLNNVTVFGTQSVAYISSSQLNIGTNLITVNTDTPSIRFGGLAVYDSGSTGLTGSILWDSTNNHWIYSNPSGSSYSGGMFISGPRTSTLGSETGTTSCMLLAGQGGDHLTSSMIYHSSTVTCIPTAIAGGSTACFASNVCVTGNADTAAGLVINNPSGNSGTCQHYINFNAGATTISRMFRGNGVSGVSANGLNIDNFDGMNIRLNQLGGSGGFLGISGGTACFSNAVCVGTNLIVRSAATFCDTVGLFGGSSQLYIGATSNASDFAVLGWCSTNRSLNIQNQSTGTGPQLIIACDGKVGVAVRDPMVQLHVRTNVASESRPTTLATSATNSAVYFTTIGGSGAGIAFGQLGANTNYIQATYENGGACTPLALNPYGGGVGIGTGNNAFSGQKLFIQSANDQAGITMFNSFDCNMWALATGTTGINNKGFAIRDEINGVTRLQIDNCGRIGIGTLSPCSVLHTVSSNGTVRFASSTGNDAGRIILMEAALDAWSIDGGQANGTFLIRDEYNSATRLAITSAGIACFNNTVCAPQFTGGFVCAVGGLNVRGASTTWSSLNLFPDNPGGAGAQCNTVLAASIVGCSGFGPQLRFSGATGGFIDIGQDCNAGFVIESSDTPSLNVTQTSRVGIQNRAPQGKLEVGIVNNNTTAGGHFFSTFQIPVNTWYTVFYAPSNGQWNAVTEFTWTSAGDFNRSGAAYMRWAYEPGAATLGVVYTLFNNSQNATASFRKSGNEIQVYITGGAADYYTQVRIQGSQAS